MLNVNNGGRANANELLDIDIKSFDDPWSAEHWSEIVDSPHHSIVVARLYGTPIAFVVFQATPATVTILKLCVKQQHRRNGASLRLLATVFAYARTANAPEVCIVVPESTIYPGPRNVSKYLQHVGFVATTPFIKGHFHVYGEPEDGVMFIAPSTTIVREPT